MNKRKLKILITAVSACVIVAAISFGVTVSYLTDREAAVNAITVGKVDVSISEGEYSDPSVPVPAGETLPKAPKLTNTGRNDEYVFLRVAIPKKAVTLLYDKTVIDSTDSNNQVTHNEGTKVALSSGQKVELFRTIADGAKKTENETEVTVASSAPVTQSTVNHEHGFSPEIDVNYNNNASGKEGWVYLDTDSKTLPDTNGSDYQCYYFGYNKRLAPNAETINLFDKIQLKSFIDEEGMVSGANNTRVDGSYKVKIDAYAVQADDLNINGITNETTMLNDDQVGYVFNIIKNKQGGGLP